MKTRFHSLSICAGILTFCASSAPGSVLMIDSFTKGRIEIGSDTSSKQDREFAPSSPEVAYRWVKGTGGAYWHVSMPSGSGALTYSVNTSGQLEDFDVFARYGFSSGHYDILAYDAFVLDFSRVLGRGILRISVKTQNVDVPVNTPGLLRVPLEMFGNPGEFHDVYGVEFTFRPTTPEFSFTLAEISLVPEPSALLLGMLGAPLLLLRRRRQ